MPMPQLIRGLGLAVLFAFGAVAVAAEDGVAKFAANKPERLRPFFAKLYADGERNAVMNLMETGAAAFQLGEYRLAERLFDDAIGRVERFYVGDENTRRARSKFKTESLKDFKGEPYERAMLFYYRGLLFARAGDFQNARAAFLNASLQDTYAEEERFRGDFGMMSFLAAWASRCDGNEARAKELVAVAAQEDARLSGVGVPRSLLLLETGVGPVKVPAGRNREIVFFLESANKDVRVRAAVEDAGGEIAPVELDLFALGDVHFQATTRGGRPVDALLKGKAVFKDNLADAGELTQALGEATTLLSSFENFSDTGTLWGLGAMVVGAGIKAVSNKVTPDADTRRWRTLPREVRMVDLDSALERIFDYELRVDAVNTAGYGAPIPIDAKTLIERDACLLVWGKTWGSVLPPSQVVPDPFYDKARKETDRRFRDELWARYPG